MNIIKKILASKTVWYLSGLTYPTAVIATHGRYVPYKKYLSECSNQMRLLEDYLSSSTVILEFGSGLGGNVVSIHNRCQLVYGVDINSHYIRIAKRNAKKIKAANVEFVVYNGRDVPQMRERPVTVFSLGVFERIPKDKVRSYLKELCEMLTEDGRLILYFLTERARKTPFTNRLGDDAYVYWSELELRELMVYLGLSIYDWKRWPQNPFGISTTCNDETSYADLLIADKRKEDSSALLLSTH